MKRFFTIVFGVLAVALVLTRLSEPDSRSELPVIYWMIDPAPVRGQHIRLFENWQVKNGHCTEHVLKTPAQVETFRGRRWTEVVATCIRESNDQGAAVLDGTITAAQLPVTIRVPKCELRLNPATAGGYNATSKRLTEAVSGVASEIMEIYDSSVLFMASGGMAADVTDDARRLGFSTDKTYAGLEGNLTYNGRQYSFPRSAYTYMLFVNKDTFARFGQPLPPKRWSIEEFEARGKAFMAAANPPGERRKHFFVNQMSWIELMQTMGLDIYNETMTRCVFNDPRAVRALALYKKWRDVDHLMPSDAELESLSTGAGGWGAQLELFANGTYAMARGGRWSLMGYRRFEKPVQMAVVEPPNGGLPYSTLYCGKPIIYAGGKQKNRDLATLFLAFYASEDYSMQIARDADGLPPVPEYTQTEEFVRPAAYTNEWGCHEMFAENAINHGVGAAQNPFVDSAALHGVLQISDRVLAGQATPEEVAREIEERTNRRIDLAVNEDPKLLAKYKEACKIQELIEQYRREERPVPREWVTNPFHRYVYERNGWLEKN